jgi:hypothetical protein
MQSRMIDVAAHAIEYPGRDVGVTIGGEDSVAVCYGV